MAIRVSLKLGIDREMNALNGGRTCSCSCSAPGGSASGDNGGANYKLGTNGGHSISGTPVICFTDDVNGIQGGAASW